MSPLARKGAELAIVAELRLHPHANMSSLRKAVELSAAEAAAAVQALRYQGKLMWDKLELSSSMLAGDEPASETAGHPVPAAEGGAAPVPPSGPDDEEDQGVNDIADHKGTDPNKARVRPPDVATSSFVPPKLLHAAGVHAANTRAAARPAPAPTHEPEIARLVREEVEENQARRHRARSTGTVRQPLELVRKFGIPDLNVSEAIGCMLSEEPRDILRAVSRKHPAMWRRCVLLARATGQQPIQTLYAALERGLGELERQTEVSDVA